MIVYDPARLLEDQITNKKSIVIIDEADMVLLDNGAWCNNKIVYGLSATNISGGSETER